MVQIHRPPQGISGLDVRGLPSEPTTSVSGHSVLFEHRLERAKGDGPFQWPCWM